MFRAGLPQNMEGTHNENVSATRRTIPSKSLHKRIARCLRFHRRRGNQLGIARTRQWYTIENRAVSRLDFTTKNQSVDSCSQLTDFSGQLGWRNQQMTQSTCRLKSGQQSEPNQPLWGALNRENTSRIEQSFLQEWKRIKSDSRNFRGTIISPVNNYCSW